MKIGVISSRANSTRTDRNTITEDAEYFGSCFQQVLNNHVKDKSQVTIISGGGSGPETHAKDVAEGNGFEYTVIPPRVRARGAKAFPERNSSIISVSDVLAIFWGGEDLYIVNALSEAMFMKKPIYLFPI